MNDDGTWWALGVVAVLGVAGVARRGSAAVPAIPDRVTDWRKKTRFELIGWDPVPFTQQDFPAFTSFSRSSWLGGGTDRYSEPHPSWKTAKAWVEERKSDPGRYGTRVDYATKPSRSATTLYSPEWLLPKGGLADDIEIRKTLAGLFLAYRDYEYPVADLPEEVQRRIRTVWLGKTLKEQGAIDLLTDELCELRKNPVGEYPAYDRERIVTEINWLHQGRFRS